MSQNNSRYESNGSATHTVLSTDCSLLLDTLGNASSRAILKKGADRALTIEELYECCDVSRTTIYRRVNELLNLGLLEESIRFTEGNQQQRQFRTTSDEITLRIGPAGLEAHIGSTDRETPSGGLLLDESSLDQFQITLSGTDLQCRIETNDEGDEAESAE